MDKLKKATIEALKKSLGRVTDACKVVDIARSTHYMWMENDPEYRRAVEETNEEAIDYVESKLFDLIDGCTREVVAGDEVVTIKDSPNPTACIFYLKTKGKKRGYVERQELTGEDGKPIVIGIPDKI
jgi:hypothetical protein